MKIKNPVGRGRLSLSLAVPAVDKRRFPKSFRLINTVVHFPTYLLVLLCVLLFTTRLRGIYLFMWMCRSACDNLSHSSLWDSIQSALSKCAWLVINKQLQKLLIALHSAQFIALWRNANSCTNKHSLFNYICTSGQSSASHSVVLSVRTFNETDSH